MGVGSREDEAKKWRKAVRERMGVKFLTASSQHLGSQLGPAGQVDVDRGSHSCTEVGGAAVDVAILLILHEGVTRFLLDRVLHGLDPHGQALEDLLDVPTF